MEIQKNEQVRLAHGDWDEYEECIIIALKTFDLKTLIDEFKASLPDTVESEFHCPSSPDKFIEYAINEGYIKRHPLKFISIGNSEETYIDSR